MTLNSYRAFTPLFVALIAATLIRPAHSAELDLTRMTLVFNEDFHHLSVSPWGPGTRWIAHTPWGGDFGDATFADPAPGFPFGETDGRFRIEMRKGADGKWQSGLLASDGPAGGGFTLRYGYFEMRAQLPPGPGVWPAFWLDSRPPPGSADPSVEIDVIEQYGKFPAFYNSTVTAWSASQPGHGDSAMHVNPVPPGSLSAGLHTFGVLVLPDETTFYRDGVVTWRSATPAGHRHGLMILVDLGLGSGWPIDQTPDPSRMFIDYIRAYADPALPSAEP